MSTIRAVEASIIETPLRHAFATAQDKLTRQVSRRVEIRLVLDNGRVAVGEATPVAYVTGETPESVVQAISAVGPALCGLDVSDLGPAVDEMWSSLPDGTSARAGVEMALYSAFAEIHSTSLWRLFGGAVDRVETDITLSIVHDAADRAMEAAERGFRCFKMKVGGADAAADLARVIEVQRAVPGARIRIDANQGFTAAGALEFIDRLLSARVTLELVEQPVPKEDLAALDEVAAASPVPVFADEAVRTPQEALEVVTQTRAHGINVKLMKSGVSGARSIIELARIKGRKLMIGCMLESRRGIAFSLALACGTDAFDFVDLDSHLLLNEEGANPWFEEDGPLLYAPKRLPLV